MLIVLGDLQAQIQHRDRARELMRATREQTIGEPGCVSYDFAEALDDPGHFLIVQRWRDHEALDHHYRSPTFARYQAHIGESLVRSAEMTVYTVQASYAPVDSAPIEPQQED